MSEKTRQRKLLTAAALILLGPVVAAIMWAATARAGQAIGGIAAVECDQDSCTTPVVRVLCRPKAFAWFGQCWSRSEGARFAGELRQHGATAKQFRARHRVLALTFAQPWPPAPVTPDPCYQSTCARAVIRAVFPDAVEEYALRIAACETGGTFYPRSLGDGGASLGLFQVHWPSWGGLRWVGSRDELLKAWHNARVALRISGGGRSWSPWTCSRLI